MQNYDRCYGWKSCLFLTCLAFFLAFFVWLAISVMVTLGMKSFDAEMFLWIIFLPTLIPLAICITPCIRCCVRVKVSFILVAICILNGKIPKWQLGEYPQKRLATVLQIIFMFFFYSIKLFTEIVFILYMNCIYKMHNALCCGIRLCVSF